MLLRLCGTAVLLSLALSAQTAYTNGNLVTEGGVNSCVDTSVTANVITCVNPAGAQISSYSVGQLWTVKLANTITGATTLSIDGLGPIAVRKISNGSLVALSAGDLVVNQGLEAFYDGTQFQCLNCSTAASTSSYNPAFVNSNTSTNSNLVAIGDSHMSGLGQATPLVGLITPTDTYTITNLAVGGTKSCAYWADHGTREAQVDALYNPLARTNILILEGGGNDMIDNNTGTPAVPWISPQQVYDCEKSYALRRKAVGWQIVLYPMYSRAQTGYNGLTGDQLHDALNALYDAGWQSFADAYMPHSPDAPAVWNDNDNTGSCFQSDHIHVNNTCEATLATQLATAINQAEFGTGTGGSGSSFNGGTVTNPVSVSGSFSAPLLTLTNSNPTDYTHIDFMGTGRSFYAGVGNAGAANCPNGYFLYDLAVGLRTCTDSTGTTTFLGGTNTNPLTINSTANSQTSLILSNSNSAAGNSTIHDQYLVTYAGGVGLYDVQATNHPWNYYYGKGLSVSGATMTETSGNNDMHGRLTLTGGTASVTFAASYTAAYCNANDETSNNAVKPAATGTGATFTGTSGDAIVYNCTFAK